MAGGTIRAGTPAKIGVSGQGDYVGTFSGALTPGHLTISGKTITLTRVRSIAPGHLALAGKPMTWLSSAWQYITITSLTSIGSVRTLYDSLDPGYSLVPSIGDIWRIPVLSRDGGVITASGDARFEIGAPTLGLDVMPAVMYYNLINATWYGPADFTILNPPLVLSIAHGRLTVTGKAMSINVTRALVPGRLVVFGHQARMNREYLVQPGHLILAGKPMQFNRQLVVSPGHLTISGKVLDLVARLSLQIEPGHLNIEGKSLGFDRSLPIEIGHLTISGKDMSLFTGLPLFMDPGHLAIDGKVLRMDKRMMFSAGHLQVRGKALLMKTTGAVGNIDKPVINSGRRRKRIRSSQP